MMRIRVITTAAELASVLDDWHRLSADRPLLHPAWLGSWWRHLGPGTGLSVLQVSDERGRTVALAPWYTDESRLHGRTLCFLGRGEVCTDYLTLPCQPGYEQPVAAAVAEWLMRRAPGRSDARDSQSWDLLDLEAVDPQDRMMRALLAELADRGAMMHRQPMANCWRMPLPASWEEYLAALSKNHRKRVRRWQRGYFDTGRARLQRVATAEELPAGLEILTRLHGQRWQASGSTGVFADRAMCGFHREAMQRLLALGALRLTWLLLDGEPVAAEYSLVAGGTLYAYQSGMSPAAAEHEPGSLALVATLREAIAEGLTAVDFLRGDEPYKRHWRAEPQTIEHVRVLPGRWSCRVRHALWRTMNGARTWLRERSGRSPEAAIEHAADIPGMQAASVGPAINC